MNLLGDYAMTIEIVWDDDEKTVMRHIYQKQYTWEEVHNSVRTMKEMVPNAERTFALIIDLTNCRAFPSGSFTTHLRSLGAEMPKNIRPMFIVGDSLMLKVMQRVMQTLPVRKNQDAFIVPRLEEAHQGIGSWRAERQARSG
jgi:hypothetical protein